jgi:protein-tyrosine phosphatase
MIDIHSHLIPGVDDGSPSIEVSVRVLEKFAAQGIEVLVCTPHLDASRASQAPYDEYREILAALRAESPEAVQLVQGWEIMLDAPGADLTAPELALGGSRALLVEFARGGVPRGGTAELRRIVRSGRTPILAHPERYFGCTIDMVREWREIGTVIQTDVSVLLGRGMPADFARAMLEQGLIDILASDNHGDDRSLAAAKDWLLERDGQDQIELLTRENAQRVLANEDPVPVPPLRAKGIVGAVKRLFTR